ncbi:SDR family NAD(P)-dependent oxidoreductase [Streptomyces virginiae]|uniref:SDR family NAD(P)-dependent oxidoreductase n=1 Tax=Streptomyces virginiae TaxID=1961 RepID=UPI003442CF9F
MTGADINGPGVEAPRTDLAAEGHTITAVRGDVSDPDDNRTMAAAAVEPTGRLDVAVANAGVLPLSDVRETTARAWDHVMAIGPVDGGYLAR